MKIVVDACLSPDWARWLTAAGHETVHWTEIGAPRAKDREIMAWAVAGGRLVLTNDLDFGAILAATGGTSPSVLQLRTENLLPDACGDRVLDALTRFHVELTAGALISIDERTQRAKVLPIRPKST